MMNYDEEIIRMRERIAELEAEVAELKNKTDFITVQGI
jgi:hypothetical protein